MDHLTNSLFPSDGAPSLPADGSRARVRLRGAEGVGSVPWRCVRTTAPDGVSEIPGRAGSANVSVSCEDFDSAISFRHFGAYLPDATIFSEITKAIRSEEVVEFGYKKLDAKAYEKRTVEPGI